MTASYVDIVIYFSMIQTDRWHNSGVGWALFICLQFILDGIAK